MKLALFYGNMTRGGAQRVMSCVAAYCVDKGDEVLILTLDKGGSEYELDSRVKVTGLDVSGDSANKLQSIRRFISTELRLRRWIKEERPDAVIVFSTKLSMQLMLARTGLRSCRVIASERANPAFRRDSLATRLGNRMLPRVDGFIFQTERISRLYPQTLIDKGAVIHNGLFSPDIPQEITPFNERRHESICAVGRLENGQKAYDVMISAFSAFSASHPEHHLDIYGSGVAGDVEKIREQIKALSLEDKVTLHGNHPHVIDEIKDAGIFLMTSRFEGMPNALIEAMACGLPCVCTDCDYGPAELIESGVSGILTPVDDAKAIAEALSSIADDEALAERLSQGALEIRQSHSREEICRQYRDYVLKVIDK